MKGPDSRPTYGREGDHEFAWEVNGVTSKVERFESCGVQVRPSREIGERVFRVRRARTVEDQRQVFALTQRVYSACGLSGRRGLVGPRPDALNSTVTLLAEDLDGRILGTLGMVFDSRKGLPCDEEFQNEVTQLRRTGRSLVEVVRLAIDPHCAKGLYIMTRMVNYMFIYSTRFRGRDCGLIEVHPRHAKFYRRVLRFEPIAGPRPCRRVNGAPASLMKLDLEVLHRELQRTRTLIVNQSKAQSLLGRFITPALEPAIAHELNNQSRPEGNYLS